ncbi:MAG: hypothetical protein ACK4R2_13925 [Roseateles sp.]
MGELYETDDARRRSVYTVFYMGINIDAALPALISEYLAQRHDWCFGFLAAAVCIALGVALLLAGSRPPRHGPRSLRAPRGVMRSRDAASRSSR